MKITTTPKLRPCPFCGSEKIQVIVEVDNCSRLQCNECGINTRNFLTSTKASHRWNRRVAEEPKWTKSPPTEEGWYWLKNVNNKPKIVYYKFGRVCFLTDSCVFGPAYEYWTEDIEEFGENVQWCKIDIPALPEEGRNEQWKRIHGYEKLQRF